MSLASGDRNGLPGEGESLPRTRNDDLPGLIHADTDPVRWMLRAIETRNRPSNRKPSRIQKRASEKNEEKCASLLNSAQLGVTTRPRVMFVASNESWSTLHRRTCFIPRMTINHGEFNELQHAAHNNTHISGEFTRAYCIPLPAMRLFFITRPSAGSFFCNF